MIPESIAGQQSTVRAVVSDSALDALRCRDDILQALYWLRGEGLGSEADAGSIARLISVEAGLVGAQLGVLADEGHLESVAGQFRLTESGAREGGRRFADEFADLQLTAHGECAPDCPHCEGIDRDGCSHCVTGRLDGVLAS
ncbi:MAG: hypothetical protein H0U58_08165 [Chloroflexi bacterium]|nr:hypothetical protein [Chloroflexota bacterium]